MARNARQSSGFNATQIPTFAQCMWSLSSPYFEKFSLVHYFSLLFSIVNAVSSYLSCFQFLHASLPVPEVYSVKASEDSDLSYIFCTFENSSPVWTLSKRSACTCKHCSLDHGRHVPSKPTLLKGGFIASQDHTCMLLTDLIQKLRLSVTEFQMTML